MPDTVTNNKTSQAVSHRTNTDKDACTQTKQQDKLKTFESHFFNMVSSQKKNFDSFYLVFENTKVDGVASANNLDDLIFHLKSRGAARPHVHSVISKIDTHGSLFNAARIFYVICKIIEEHLSDSEGFDEKTREKYYQTLIYFTDFALLRLICIYTAYFPESKIASHITANKILRRISKRSGLGKYISDISL